MTEDHTPIPQGRIGGRMVGRNSCINGRYMVDKDNSSLMFSGYRKNPNPRVHHSSGKLSCGKRGLPSTMVHTGLEKPLNLTCVFKNP